MIGYILRFWDISTCKLRNRKQRLELKQLTILENKNGLCLYFLKHNKGNLPPNY